MIELSKNTNELTEIVPALVQLRHLSGESVYISDPEGNKIEIKTTAEGTKIVFTKDEEGRSLAIEERANGTKLYHISKDSTGLPSSHEVREDKTEIIYFYNQEGYLKHFVELRPNGNRISTVMGKEGSIYSIDQKQIGGIIFQAWIPENNEIKEGLVWLHPDGEVSTHGHKEVILELLNKFHRFLDGVRVNV
ncbi:MAG: hypothetical protein A3I68_02365 [Candidatus Melainabacteria bacterium RIFCSPLOWO2_02_FULL_35_15]|nr:MAG: hypothetical protein A3F80_00500 [Candidatus Melainabacteria bacterium RIFCSPLOWO2_12_FULL_35_11]OGI13251.1 MAG: hypothetical protein A3I68_02365 [Candidatus Melainabacteria bacterium RIFCSPLOWO2_02_FULL_35_15]